MAKVVVLGAGVMGSALSVPLCDNGHEVHIVGTHLDSGVIEEIRKTRTHPGLRVRLPAQVVAYTHDQLTEAMQGADLVLLGVSSLAIEWAAEVLGPVLRPEVPILAVTKGLAGDGQRLYILPDVLRSRLPADYRDEVQLAAIAGPSIAAEVAVRRHTCVVFAGEDQALLDRLAALFRTAYYHVWTSTDVIGVEVCAALKNTYALAVGMVAGMLEREGAAENDAAMNNMAAAIFAQSLWELAYLVNYMGGHPRSIYALPGAGDLYVTCYQGGRNLRMGRLLGLGMRYSEARTQKMPGVTVEGAESARAIGPTIKTLVDQGELDGAALPLLRTLIAVVCDDAPVQIPWDSFFHGHAPVSPGG